MLSSGSLSRPDSAAEHAAAPLEQRPAESCLNKGRVSKLTALLCLGMLSACGGGVYLELGDDPHHTPPSVSLVSSVTEIHAGQTLRLAAAATAFSANRINVVTFYRWDDNIAVQLGSDRQAPYELAVTAPSDGRASVSYFARAWDDSGDVGESQTVTVSVWP